MPTPPTDDFTSVSDIGAATGGSPYKRMKQPWGSGEKLADFNRIGIEGKSRHYLKAQPLK